MPTELEILTEILHRVSGLEEALNEVLLPAIGGISKISGDAATDVSGTINNDGSNIRPTHTITPTTLNWTLSKTDLIELIYALHSGGAFNRGTATIAQITRFFESVLSIQLGNTSMVFQEILRRKDSTAFLHRLIEKLEEHIENIDEKKFR